MRRHGRHYCCKEILRSGIAAASPLMRCRLGPHALQGKLMLVQELVRVLDRLGLGLGANGRPGLISLLLNR